MTTFHRLLLFGIGTLSLGLILAGWMLRKGVTA